MDLLIVALLIAVLALGVAFLVVLTRRPAAPDGAGAMPQATAATVIEGVVAGVNQRLLEVQDKTQANAATLVTTMGSQEFGKHAKAIDTRLDAVVGGLTARIGELDQQLTALREVNSAQYTGVQQAVDLLRQRTENLNEVLSNSQKRGQWGERLAEDMLRAAGLVEGKSYEKQARNATGGRPDYTFKMPPDRVLLMDVKFPLDKYAEFVKAQTDADRNRARAEFVAAVKGHVDALAKRDYILKDETALDYVLMFVPNESISGFVHESDSDLIDWALERKVVLCSPLTLYAFLVVIRQATDSFHTEQAAASIMQQINKFSREWEKYVEAVDDVKGQFTKLNAHLDAIATDGTRFRKLRVPIRDIERMRTAQGIPELPAGADDAADEDEDDGAN